MPGGTGSDSIYDGKRLSAGEPPVRGVWILPTMPEQKRTGRLIRVAVSWRESILHGKGRFPQKPSFLYFYSFSLESGSQPLNSSWYKLVLYLTVPQYTALLFYAVVVRPPLTLSMESPLPDLTGLQVALSGLPFSFSSPSTL